ncbi:uncharacterized protein LOC114130401 [Aphis gossypii]|uniref:uncharacterized protein LOC114130401 n=1 Tax=Aphis gossypii TaxID=80765 RepID=UPI002158B5B4|nr:uncharacterized protein LOC114130401 [Aphis gossypii]
MKEVLLVALLSVVWSLRPIGTEADVVRVKTPAPAPEARANDDDDRGSQQSSATVSDNVGVGSGDNGTSPCDRYLRSAEVEVRNPRNHKFVTSNGWAERQRPRPEISVYSRVEEIPSPQPPAAAAASFYRHQQDSSSFYQNSRQQQPAVQRTSKRIIYYATLPDVVRAPASYPPLAPYTADPFALGPGPFSADFRQLQQDSGRKALPDSLQRNRLTSYENAYNRGGNGGNGITSVTTKSTGLYNSRYDEPAEFRESYYRPNELTTKYASWAEPFYKSWTSSSWDKDRSSFDNNNRISPSFSWDREPLTRSGGPWDREPINRGGGSWDREPLGVDGGGGSSWENRGSSWDNRGSSWDKDLVEVPLQKPYRGGGNELFNNNKYNPEVAVVHSGVIDVRGDRKPNESPHPAPPPRFTIIDVDPKPYNEQQPPTMRYDERVKSPMQQNMRYDPPQKPMRYETYMPMQQQPPPSMMRYEQQYRSPQQQQQQPPPPSSTRYGQQQKPQNNQPSNGYYESIKNNINTHQFMTSWTEVSTQDDEVTPTHSVTIDIASVGNSTSIQNNSRITPNTNTTKIPK